MDSDNRPVRELPDFSDSEAVKAWSEEWEDNTYREHASILGLIQAVSVESAFHGSDYKDHDLDAMNNLIAAWDEYAFDPDEDALKQTMLVALSKAPTTGTDIFVSERGRFLTQSSKEEADKIMANILGGNDFPSP